MHYRGVRVLTVLLAAVLSLGGKGLAQNVAYRFIRVNVPFDFTVDQKPFRAGDYMLACAANTIELRDSQGHTIASVYPHSVQAQSNPNRPKLVFNTVGGGRELWQVWTEDSRYGYELAAPRPELMVAKQHRVSASPIKTGGNQR
ncbi:MAG TPA: hypothetical protein VFO39_08900 [Candidatus Sulfotelmatobacter sp.]|nr:hypothetical protein [Candidatus Sulfotelmatobacter sp.]